MHHDTFADLDLVLQYGKLKGEVGNVLFFYFGTAFNLNEVVAVDDGVIDKKIDARDVGTIAEILLISISAILSS